MISAPQLAQQGPKKLKGAQNWADLKSERQGFTSKTKVDSLNEQAPRIQVSISGFNFKFHFKFLISSFNFMFQFQVSISSFNLRIQFQDSVSSFIFKFHFQVSFSSFIFKFHFQVSVSCFKFQFKSDSYSNFCLNQSSQGLSRLQSVYQIIFLMPNIRKQKYTKWSLDKP